MQVPKEKLRGKRQVLNLFEPDVSDLNIPHIQRLMKKINNCKATSWKCKSCPIPTLARCFSNVTKYLQMEAFKKYRNKPEYKKQQEKINREKLYKKIKI